MGEKLHLQLAAAHRVADGAPEDRLTVNVLYPHKETQFVTVRHCELRFSQVEAFKRKVYQIPLLRSSGCLFKAVHGT